MARPITVYPTGGAVEAWLPILPIPDRPHTRSLGIVGRCAPMGKQVDFITSPYRNTFYSGGSGSGKTAGAAYLFCLRALAVKDGLGLVISKDRNMLRNVEWRAVVDQLEWWGKINGFSFISRKLFNELRIVLINGFEIIFKPADDAAKFVGMGADIIWGDEVSVWPDQINLFQKLQARLRGSRQGEHRCMIFSSTPDGNVGVAGLFLQHCTKEMRPDVWVSETPQDKIGTEGWCLIYGDTSDNKVYAPDYVKNICETMSKELAEQETKGKIISVSGSVYSNYFSMRESIARGFKYDPKIHEVHVCIDWGQNKPYVGLIAHDPAARAGAADRPVDVVFDEYVKDRRGLHKALLRWIRERMRVHGIQHITAFYPDPAGVQEIAALRNEFPNIPVRIFSKTTDREIRWGVDVLSSRLLTLEGKRFFFVAEDLANQEQNTDPRGRGCVRMFLGLRWEEKRGAESVFRDKLNDDEHLINCADGIRYYVVHQYQDIGRAAYLV